MSHLANIIHLTDDRGAVFSLHLILVCPITGNVNFDHLIDVVSGFSTIKLFIFLL